MALGGFVLGIFNIAIWVAIMILVGFLILWGATFIPTTVPADVQKWYMIVVALMALYMLVALLFGLPSPFRSFL